MKRFRLRRNGGVFFVWRPHGSLSTLTHTHATDNSTTPEHTRTLSLPLPFPQDRCRLAHTLGNLALTPAGDELFHHDPVYVRRFYGVIRGVAALYARQWAEERKAGMSDTVVPRPCVAGYCMLALACLVKREAQERWFLRRMGRMQQQEKEEGGGGFSVVGFLLGPEDPFASLRCMEGAAVAGGRPPTEEPGQEEEGGEEEELGPDGLGRLRVLWRMLVHLTREVCE